MRVNYLWSRNIFGVGAWQSMHFRAIKIGSSFSEVSCRYALHLRFRRIMDELERSLGNIAASTHRSEHGFLEEELVQRRLEQHNATFAKLSDVI
jgi:hypothetical protein